MPRPLVVRRDIRDKFDAPDTPIQQLLLTLKSALGIPVRLDINWLLLWSDHESRFADKAAFVPYIIPYVFALLGALNVKLEEDESSWTEELLEVLKHSQNLRLGLQVWSNPISQFEAN